MRIALKHLRTLLVVFAFFAVLGLLWRQRSQAATVSQSSDPATATAHVESKNRLSNPGFADYQQVRPYDNKAVLLGVTPESWRDDSGWAQVHANYTADRTRPHGGAVSLKMDVLSVQLG